MDQRRLLLFIAISVAIFALFQFVFPPPPRPAHPANTPVAANVSAQPPQARPEGDSEALPTTGPRLAIEAPNLVGSMSLTGARLDDLRLRDFHETVDRNSPLVRLLERPDEKQPSYLQFGWLGPDGVKLPDDRTQWHASAGTLRAGEPVALTWDNGAGLSFRIDLAIDKQYLFNITQSVHNAGTAPVQLWPWQRVRRDYAPLTSGYGVLFEGLIGAVDNRIKEMGYPGTKSAAEKHDGTAFEQQDQGGWAGFTDKYWLTALIPDQQAQVKTSWAHTTHDGNDRYQISYVTASPQTVAPGGDASFGSRDFVGAKEVHLLDRYESRQHIPLLSYAVDWGWFFFLTKPFFYAIDFIYSLTGNFGVAILIFTVFVKLAFYPLAATSYRSMGKMRLLAPKIQAARERFKDDPARQQQAMMEVYKQEGVSPMAQAGGCLPLVIQIPVFFSLYKVILVTIEMRHAPFFGWIHDLSATDPTNVFNLFGLLPFDPSAISSTLHLGIWPLILGATMFFQQRLNPPPPDPTQARIFQFMPIVFTFMMGRFPAGLVIYWSWNNTLTIAQQWYIQRNAKLTGPATSTRAKAKA